MQDTKDDIQRRRSQEESKDKQEEDEESKGSSISSYGTGSDYSKGKFKCKACALSFVSKKLYEKHCKTSDHKVK